MNTKFNKENKLTPNPGLTSVITVGTLLLDDGKVRIDKAQNSLLLGFTTGWKALLFFTLFSYCI
jgi:hypothetical protein